MCWDQLLGDLGVLVLPTHIIVGTHGHWQVLRHSQRGAEGTKCPHLLLLHLYPAWAKVPGEVILIIRY